MVVGVEPSTDPDVMTITSMPAFDNIVGDNSDKITQPISSGATTPPSGTRTGTPGFVVSTSPIVSTGAVKIDVNSLLLTPLDTGAVMISVVGVKGAYWCDIVSRTSNDKNASLGAGAIAAKYGDDLMFSDAKDLSAPVRSVALI